MNLSKEALRARMVGLASTIPQIRRLRDDRDLTARERDRLAAELEAERATAPGEARMQYPPGHFYSPIPDLDLVARDAARIFANPRDIVGVDLRPDAQRACFEAVAACWTDYPYYTGDDSSLRYEPTNAYFGHMDGLVLFGMLTTIRPKRYVEIGSGWSSALVLDTRERLGYSLECTFIEPDPDRLRSLLRPGDHDSVEIVDRPLQEVDRSYFDGLESGDVLFIDSSHISKVGSDVNLLFFDVLPRIPTGVWVHVHDIGYPFEYPRAWIEEGRAWNEAYVLHAMLLDNPRWQIELWCDYLSNQHRAFVDRLLPTGGQRDGLSIWMVRR